MAGPKKPATPEAPASAAGGDILYCLVKMNKPETQIFSATVKDLAGKPKTELDFTGATATSSTVTGAGDKPERNFSIDVKGGTCTVGGQQMNMYREDGPPRGGMPPSISEPVSPASGPAPRR